MRHSYLQLFRLQKTHPLLSFLVAVTATLPKELETREWGRPGQSTQRHAHASGDICLPASCLQVILLFRRELERKCWNFVNLSVVNNRGAQY